MKSNFKVFGPAHFLILISIPLISAALGACCRRSTHAALVVRYSLAAALAVVELVWYVYVFRIEGLHFPDGLPLELCDVTLWVAVAAAISLNPLVFEIVYYAGIAGSGMAILTPDLWVPLWSYGAISFFLAHGITVAIVLTLLWGKLAAPRPGSMWKVLAIVNAYAVVVGVFDAIFKTNYMYLRQKPAAASLLNYLGPWPVYLLGAEVAAAALFWLLWLPFRKSHA